MSAGRRGNGFTLIEVLIATAIIAIALAAVLTETAHYISSASRMQDRTLAHWVAVDRITEQQVSGAWPSAGVSNGSVEIAGREWFWTMTVADTPDEAIRRIDVDVRADTDQERIDATAIAYLERPVQ